MKKNEKFEFLKETLGGQFLLSGLLKTVISEFDDERQIDEIDRFFDTPVANAAMAINQGKENIKIQSDWFKRDGHKICTFLRKL